MLAGRLPWLAPSDLDEDQRRVYDEIVSGPRGAAQSLTDPEGRLYGPFNALLVNPAIGGRVQALGAALRFETALTPRCREIATLIAAAVVRSNYEWDAHVKLGQAAGLSVEEIDAIFHGTDAPTFDPQEVVTGLVARSILEGSGPDEALFERALEVLGRVQLSDLIVLIGYYRLLANVLEIWQVPLRDGVTPKFP